jgi:hypothetical protein
MEGSQHKFGPYFRKSINFLKMIKTTFALKMNKCLIILLCALAIGAGCNSEQDSEPSTHNPITEAPPPKQFEEKQLSPEEQEMLGALQEAFKPDMDPKTPFAELATPFAVFELPEFEQDNISVVRGLGGYWVSARFISTTGAQNLARQDLLDLVTSAYTNLGWATLQTPSHNVASEKWESSKDDISFSFSTNFNDGRNAFYNCSVHVSTNADVVCIYTGIGW